jgi:hypothetical protein
LTSASVLWSNQLYLDSMYLAGYTFECALKALILSRVPIRQRPEFLREYFHGAVAHNYEYLSLEGFFTSEESPFRWRLQGTRGNSAGGRPT